MKKLLLAIALVCVSNSAHAAGGGSRATQPNQAAKVGARGTLVHAAPGVDIYAALVKSGPNVINVWTYVPAQRAKGAKLPLILIASAGTSGVEGNSIGASSMPEHLPYVRAGYAVAYYEMVGAVRDNGTPEDYMEGAIRFRSANFGVTNASSALDHAFKYFPIDKKRVYTAGHSSAGTVALTVGAKEPRVRGVIAYAPVTDLETDQGPENTAAMEASSPGWTQYLRGSSPINLTRKLAKPVFLFHADDDSRVTLQDNAIFWNKLRKTNTRVTFVRVASGDHYDSMIQQGIPAAIAWLKKIK